jgi:hypothetical protein
MRQHPAAQPICQYRTTMISKLRLHCVSGMANDIRLPVCTFDLSRDNGMADTCLDYVRVYKNRKSQIRPPADQKTVVPPRNKSPWMFSFTHATGDRGGPT